ncbi:MAG: hypothetical protein ACP5D7_24610, partial [Limnospira sp.]
LTAEQVQGFTAEQIQALTANLSPELLAILQPLLPVEPEPEPNPIPIPEPEMGSVGNNSSIPTDNERPSVTINQAENQIVATTKEPFNFTVEFSEPITGFDEQDILLGGTAGATTVNVTPMSNGENRLFNVAVSGMTQEGTVIATVRENAAEDASGNQSLASTSQDNLIDFFKFASTPSPELPLRLIDVGHRTALLWRATLFQSTLFQLKVRFLIYPIYPIIAARSLQLPWPRPVWDEDDNGLSRSSRSNSEYEIEGMWDAAEEPSEPDTGIVALVDARELNTSYHQRIDNTNMAIVEPIAYPQKLTISSAPAQGYNANNLEIELPNKFGVIVAMSDHQTPANETNPIIDILNQMDESSTAQLVDHTIKKYENSLWDTSLVNPLPEAVGNTNEMPIVVKATQQNLEQTDAPSSKELVVIDAIDTDNGMVEIQNIDLAVILENARVIGDANSNIVIGDNASQTVYLGDGEDEGHGGEGPDVFYGGQKGDEIWGNQGLDYLSGDRDNDTLYGGKGADTLDGGSGNDDLHGDSGDDLLIGGEGSDRFHITPTSGTDTIADFEDGIDQIILEEGLTFEQLAIAPSPDNLGATIARLDTGEVLAILNGIDITRLTENDFAIASEE